MDKQLIAMCNCDEIQDMSEPIMGGLFYTAGVLHVIADVHNTGRFTLVSRPKIGEWILYRTEGIFIPRMEEFVEWLMTKSSRKFAKTITNAESYSIEVASYLNQEEEQ